MKVVYYYRGRTGSAGFLLPEDMALLKRLFAHGSLPPKAQLRGKRCWLYLRVNTNNPAADEIGISRQDTYLRQLYERAGSPEAQPPVPDAAGCRKENGLHPVLQPESDLPGPRPAGPPPV